MAIVISEEEKRINWKVLIGILVVFIILGASTYYLFFSPTPFIESIAPPPELKKISDISEITIDKSTIQQVTDHPVRILLKNYVAPPAPGTFGRPNPFLSNQ